MRFDSGFWSNDTIATLGRLDVRYTMAVRTNTKGIGHGDRRDRRDAWVDIDYTARRPGPGRRDAPTTGRRLIVRRTRLTDTPPSPGCGPTGATSRFLTDLAGDAVDARRVPPPATPSSSSPSATSKKAPGSSTSRPGNFYANGAWLQCAVLAHNLIRWTATLGQPGPVDQLTVARTVRTRLIAIPGRLVNRSGTPTLRGPLNWPWAALVHPAPRRHPGPSRSRIASDWRQEPRPTSTGADNRTNQRTVGRARPRTRTRPLK